MIILCSNILESLPYTTMLSFSSRIDRPKHILETHISLLKSVSSKKS